MGGGNKTLTSLIFIFFFLAGILWLSLDQLRPPTPVDLDGSPDQFSAARAMEIVKSISKKPHPIGSAENKSVKEVISGEFKKLGLNPEIQSTVAIQNSRYVSCAPVENIIARLKGTNPGKALMLVGHYDTVPTAPGASDNASSVATLIETLRALKQGEALKNDIIFLLTDGEEIGLMGAQAFFVEHPWAKDVGMVLNFEARGTSGASLMFESSPQNGFIVREFSKIAPNPVGSSIMYEVYNKMPNNTDFTIFKNAKIPGLNFAYIENGLHYHTRYDNIENINRGSLQHHGSSALALARHFGNLDLTNIKENDAVYFNLLSSLLVVYSTSWVIPLMILTIVAFIGVIILGIRKKDLTIKGLSGGFLVFLVPLILSPLLVTCLQRFINYLHVDYLWSIGNIWDAALYFSAYIFISIAITMFVLSMANKKLNWITITIGGLCWWLILLIPVSLYFPGVSYLFTWPLLFSLLGMGIMMKLKEKTDPESWKSLFTVSISTIPGLMLISPFIVLLFAAFSVGLAGVMMIFVVLLLGVTYPLFGSLSQSKKRFVPGLSLLIGILIIAFAGISGHYSEKYPERSSISYVLNKDDNHAVWAAIGKRYNSWVGQFIKTPRKDPLERYMPNVKRWGKTFLVDDAPVIELPAPEIKLIEHRVDGNVHTLEMRFRSSRDAEDLIFVVEEGKVVGAAIDNKQIDLNKKTIPQKNSANKANEQLKENPWRFQYFQVPQTGIHLKLEIQSTKQIKILVMDSSYGIPDQLDQQYEKRPAGIIEYPGMKDPTIVAKTYIF
jgi:Peptidase family M28